MALPTTWRSVAAGDTSNYIAQMGSARVALQQEQDDILTDISTYTTNVQQENQSQAEMELAQLPSHEAREAFLQTMENDQQGAGLSSLFAPNVTKLHQKLPGFLTDDVTIRKDKDRVHVLNQADQIAKIQDPAERRSQLNAFIEANALAGINDPNNILTTAQTSAFQEIKIDHTNYLDADHLKNAGLRLVSAGENDELATFATDSYTKDSYNKLIDNIAHDLGVENSTVLYATRRKMAQDAVDRSPHGIHFKRRMKDEKDRTYPLKRMRDLAAKVEAHLPSLNKVSGQYEGGNAIELEKVMTEMSEILNTNPDIPDEQKNWAIGMIRRALDSTALLPKKATEFPEGRYLETHKSAKHHPDLIGQPVDEIYELFIKFNGSGERAYQKAPGSLDQKRFLEYITDIYHKKYPKIPRDILKIQAKERINVSKVQDAYTAGNVLETAEKQATQAAIEASQQHTDKNRELLYEIGNSGGVAPAAWNRVIKRMKQEYGDDFERQSIRTIKEEIGKASKKVLNVFRNEQGLSTLTLAQEQTLHVGMVNFFEKYTALDQDRNFIFNWFGDDDDIGLVGLDDEITDVHVSTLLQGILESLPSRKSDLRAPETRLDDAELVEVKLTEAIKNNPAPPSIPTTLSAALPGASTYGDYVGSTTGLTAESEKTFQQNVDALQSWLGGLLKQDTPRDPVQGEWRTKDGKSGRTLVLTD